MNIEQRNKLAESMRHYLSGRISNFEFMERTEELWVSKDKAVRKIMQSFWMGYDDLKEHKNEGKHKISSDGELYVKTMILFLKSDNEYNWEDLKYDNIPFLRAIIYLVTFGKYPEVWDKEIMKKGDYDVWPFLTKSEFDNEISNPKYLNKLTEY